MLLAIIVFELLSGQTYIRNYPIRISSRMSGRMIGLSSNFHQYFKITIYTHPASFRQIGWIWGNFIRPDFRPDIRIFTKIARTLFWYRNMNSWKFHVDRYHRFWVIFWTNKQTSRQTNATKNITSPISSAEVIMDYAPYRYPSPSVVIHRLSRAARVRTCTCLTYRRHSVIHTAIQNVKKVITGQHSNTR